MCRDNKFKPKKLLLFKLNRDWAVWTCACDWVHIVRGPAGCWVCRDQIGFAEWQIGKADEPGPSKLTRTFCADDRDRSKDNLVKQIKSADEKSLTYAKVKWAVAESDGPRAMGWPEEPGLGKADRFGFAGMPDTANVHKLFKGGKR